MILSIAASIQSKEMKLRAIVITKETYCNPRKMFFLSYIYWKVEVQDFQKTLPSMGNLYKG